MAKKDEVRYREPADQVARKNWEESERNRIAGEEPATDEGRSFQIEGHDSEGYVGVNPEYMNSASDHNAPLVKTDEFLDESQHLGIRPVGGKLAKEQAKHDRELAEKLAATRHQRNQELRGTASGAAVSESTTGEPSTTPAQPSQPTTPATPSSPDKGDTSKTTGK